MTRPDPAPLSVGTARLCLVAAAVLWSGSGFYMRLLREPTGLGLDDPLLSPLQVAFFRGLFAGLVLVPFVRRRDVRVRPATVGMVGCFAVMSGLFLTALGHGQAANAILLQNTAPVWVYLVAVGLLRDPPDRRSGQAVFVGLVGAVVLVAGNALDAPSAAADPTGGATVLFLGAGSGLAYAAVILLLRYLRDDSPAWLTLLNLLGSALLLGLGVALVRLPTDGPAAVAGWFLAPTAAQLACLAVFGAVQMAAPYFLFARGLRTVGPQEAGIITLLEPVLSPVWAYLVAPDKEVPTVWTWAGGGLLLAALAWRYLPHGAGRRPGRLNRPPAGIN